MSGPIVIRGVEYPSKEAAAAAFGIKPDSVARAMRRGGLDKIGLPRGPSPLPVRIGKRGFPSAQEAAKRLRVSISTVYSALCRGKEDTVGVGRGGRRATNGKGWHHPHSKPVKIGSMEWPSIGSAAKYLGVTDHAIRYRLKIGDRDWIAARLMDVLASNAGQNGKLPASQDKEALSQMGRARWERRRQIEEARAQ